ncbi:MAG: hypothetical protein AAGA44_00240 [Pseudomonadota bacterium]
MTFVSDLFDELKRRNVFRVGIAYVVASWVLIQVAETLVPILQLPEWTARLVFVILAIGLVPALIFAWAYELTPEGIKRERDVNRDESITGDTGKRLNNVIVGVLAVAVIFLLYDRRTDDAAVDATTESAAEDGADTTGTQQRPSVAVLPFVNMSDDEDYFADGITEEILNALAGVDQLKVSGRTSSFAFKGKNQDLRLIGEALGVEHILEGSVRRSGDTVRITAQLIHAEDGFHRWSETYDRKLENIFDIQDEISNEILSQLSVTLLGESVPVTAKNETDPVTYQLYLRAKQRLYTRELDEIRSAVEELNLAIERDPDYAAAYAQRGIAAMLLSEQQYGDTPHMESNRRGRRFVDLALQIDPELPEALAGLGLFHLRTGGNSDLGIDALSRALELNPNNTDARNWLQIALSDQGRSLEALEMIRSIAEIDPLYKPAFGNGIMKFAALDLEDEAEAWIERLGLIDPDSDELLFAQAVNHNANGRIAEAVTTLDSLRERQPLTSMSKFIFSDSLLRIGDYGRLIEEGHVFFKPFALDFSGRTEEAFELADRLASTGVPDPYLALLSQYGRYKEITDFIEESWPSLEVFAGEHRGDEWQYFILIDIAHAYRETGNTVRFQQALSLLDAWEENNLEQGVGNDLFLMSRAELAALRGEKNLALEFATLSVSEYGYMSSTMIIEFLPGLRQYANEPVMIELEITNRARVNEARAAVNLPPLDPIEDPRT